MVLDSPSRRESGGSSCWAAAIVTELLSFDEGVEAVRSQLGVGLLCSGGPEDFDLIDVIVIA